MLRAIVASANSWMTALFRNGKAPLDAEPCCHEAVYRLFGRCDDGCCGDSHVQSLVEDWAERRREGRVTELKTSQGRH